MMRILTSKEIHLSGLARELKISKPVASRHIKLLEKTGLVEKRIIGNVHLFKSKIGILEEMLDTFSEETSIKIKKNKSIFDAIKQIPGIEIKQIGDKQYITSINGENGLYIYEVDGKAPNISIDQYKPQKNVTLHLKKIITVNKKKVDIKIEKQN